jgi:hypothetical protein
MKDVAIAMNETYAAVFMARPGSAVADGKDRLTLSSGSGTYVGALALWSPISISETIAG